MGSIIKVLPEHIANQIAAGEVVNRPSSAVKELLENAVDAEATEISLYIEDAGKTLIRVIDNGIGMSEEDAQTAFLPHATSKIQDAGDLLHIETMGFRGEALASIASVTQIELRTHRKDDELGTQLEIDGGVIKNIKPIVAPQGTNISVKNIYFNTPARRKFLSSDDAEYRYIEDVFTKIALAYPEISFSFYKNSTRVLHLPSGTQRSRVIQVFGNTFQQRLVKVGENLSDVSIDGYICKPDYTIRSRNKQYLFVNNRIIKHTGLNHAIEDAFSGLIPEKSYPVYCIFIEVDPSTIDVNIHPAKTEIRFHNEKLIYSTLHAVVKHSIGIHQLSPSLDFNTFQIPLATPRASSHNNSNYDSNNYGGNSFSKVSDDFKRAYLKSISEIQKAEDELLQKDIESLQGELPLNEPDMDMTADDSVFQVAESYIIAPYLSELLLIDQQTASERILFDGFCNLSKSQQSTKLPSKILLFPQPIDLSASQTEILKEIQPTLELLGWDFSWLGDNAFMINAMPEQSNEKEAQKIIEDIIDLYVQKQMNGSESFSGTMSKQEKVAAVMAKRTSIKHGEKLHKEEMLSIIVRLFSSSNPQISPSGQKTFRIISKKELSELLI
ncbi:MAG: DNA mismatch repair endonuclease MutL [Bacteroidales bacterium]|jgi:DNA mismatch repair protein MutL|nr:DNA mismatch repair endonuclease MutL [Bacteroidales bacterium]